MGLAQSQLLQVPEAVAGELWSRLAPSAALSAADPARRVEVLPYHAAEPLKVVVCGGTGAGKPTLLNALWTASRHTCSCGQARASRPSSTRSSAARRRALPAHVHDPTVTRP